MKFLFWLERHLAWFRVDGHFAARSSAASSSPSISTVHAEADEGDGNLRRKVIFNITASVGSAVLIGVLSGIATAERVGQRITDTLTDHETRIGTIESQYVPAKVHAEKDAKVQAQFDAIREREAETRTELVTLQTEFNQLLLQRMQRAPER